MRPLILALLLTTPAHAATISLTTPAVPANYIKVQPEFTDVLRPREYLVRGKSDWLFTPQDGFAALIPQNINPVPPAHWTLPPFWVAKADAGFSIRPTFYGLHANINLTEFIAAGDSMLTLKIDGTRSGTEPWNTVTWVSPGLGTVLRTYTIIPEPSTLLLTAAVAFAATTFHHARRRELSSGERRAVPA